MDSDTIFKLVMEKYPGKEPREILEIVKMFRKGLDKIEKEMLEESCAIKDSNPIESSELTINRIDFLSSKYQGKWVKEPDVCVQDDLVFCAICGKSGQLLTSRHLAKHDGMSSEEYKKICGYSSDKALMSNNYMRLSKDRMTKGSETYNKRMATLEQKASNQKGSAN